MSTAANVSVKRAPAKIADTAPGWFLVGYVGDKEGLSQVPIGKVPFAIGRHTSNDLQIPSRSISKSHAQIIVAVDAVIVQDLGSTNGTFVNGKRISAPTPVGEGDLLQFAEVELRLGRAASGSVDHTA